MILPYDPQAVESVGHALDLRTPNRLALDAIARSLDEAEPGAELVADLATGVGKTFIAGALLDYLYEGGIRHIVLITPGKTIQRKTIDNFTPGHRKYLRGLKSNPLVITLDDLERGDVAANLADDSRLKLFVFTVQSLLRPDTADARRAHRAHESLGVAIYDHLKNVDDLIVIADEHHIYYSGQAKKFQQAIDDLKPQAMIGLTATPHESSESKIVYKYPLADAIADGFVKVPVLVARQDGLKDLRTQMADGVALLNAKVAAINAYSQQTKKKAVNPLLFVVAETIDEANKIRTLLATPEYLDGDEKVLLITSEEPDATLALLDTLEDENSPIRAVVSVSMLKEGWDVASIYVIAAVRAMESKLLTEQVLGRGLRLPYGSRTGVPMLDTVEVLSHHSFSSLLKEARVLLEETLGQRAQGAVAHVNTTPGVASAEFTLTAPEVQAAAQHVEISIPSLFDLDENEPEQSEPGFGFATVEARIIQAEEARETLTAVFIPRTPGGVRIPLFLPRVSTRWEREPFSLTQVNLVDVEALGRVFAEDNGATLIRKALDAKQTETGAILSIHDEADNIFASQPLMDFDDIESDLTSRILRENAVSASITEMNAAVDVAKAFLAGAEVSEDTPWRAEHGRLATQRLIEWISTQQSSRPAREVREVNNIRYPEPPEKVETKTPADRQLITSSRDFVRGYPYRGWEKSIYENSSFDAYSTEFRLAELFEKSADIKAWVRVVEDVPLRINYFQGAIQRQYMPDFIVIDKDNKNWLVEGKSDVEMTNPVVLAKQDAAKAWVDTVNSSSTVNEKWGYVLASESVISAASSWASLKAAAQTHS